jgi:photosystem II stability/assembly factor-like uncharacterized protein
MRGFRGLGPLLLAGALLSASCRDATLPVVEVREVEVRGVPDTALLAGSTVGPLLATPRDGSGRALEGRAVAWSSSDDAVARVDAAGMLTAVAPGTAVIAAEVEGRRGSAAVTVVPRPALRLSAAEVHFAATEGEGRPADQRVEVANAGGGVLDGLAVEVGFAAGEPEGWLRAELSARSAPAVLALSVRGPGPAVGSYEATVRVRSPAAENGPGLVRVRLEVEPRWTGPLRFEPVAGTPTRSDLRGVWGSGPGLVAVGDSGTILRSTDAGVTWSSARSGSRHQLRGVWGAGSTVVAVGDSGTILRSVDAGASWSPVESGTTDLLRGVSGDGSTLVVVGNGGRILRSSDAGASWSPASSGSLSHRLAGVWGQGSTWFAVGDSFEAGTPWALTVVSADSGRTWSDVPQREVGFLAAVWGEGDTVVAVGSTGRHGLYEWILRSTDAGAGWSHVTRWSSGGGLWSGPYAVAGTGSTLVAVGNYGRIHHSTDGGASWSLLASGTGSWLHGVWLAGGRNAIVVGAGGLILRGTP